MVSEASNPQDLVTGGVRLTVRKNDEVGRKLSALRNLEIENSASPRAESLAAEFVAALAERGGRRAPCFPSVDHAELTRSAAIRWRNSRSDCSATRVARIAFWGMKYSISSLSN
jgi:hypothetical protein